MHKKTRHIQNTVCMHMGNKWRFQPIESMYSNRYLLVDICKYGDIQGANAAISLNALNRLFGHLIILLLFCRSFKKNIQYPMFVVNYCSFPSDSNGCSWHKVELNTFLRTFVNSLLFCIVFVCKWDDSRYKWHIYLTTRTIPGKPKENKRPNAWTLLDNYPALNHFEQCTFSIISDCENTISTEWISCLIFFLHL